MADKRSREHLLEAAIDVQTIPAIDADAVCYIPRLFSSIALPVRRVNGTEYSRRNGRYKLHLVSAQDIGLPYGTYPRLLLIHLTTQAKLTGEREIYLGNSMSQLFRSMGIINSGGENGPLRAFKAQTKRLLAATLLYTEESTTGWELESIRIANKVSMVWEPMNPLQWEAYIKLDEAFFLDIAQRAVPIDKRVVRACSHYPLALDIYCWLTHRYFHMHQPQSIRWEQLANQFGNSYTRNRVFRQKFNQALARVSLFYPKARFSAKAGYLLLYPSPSHVPLISHV